MTVVAPFALSYTNRVPYISIAEFKAWPTGLDLSNLIEKGTQEAQDTSLAELILAASAKADNYCMGAYGTLCATVNTENEQIRADRHGYYRVHPKFWPILAVDSFSLGPTPAEGQALDLSPENCWIEESTFVITQGALSSVTSFGPLQFGAGGLPGRRQFATWTYVNGWPNLFLAADVAASATSIESTVIPQGVYPGSSLNIWDPPTNEMIVVGPSYVPGSMTIPLASPLQFAHKAGVNVSALPKSVKEAVVHLVVAEVRSRGDQGFTLGPQSAPQEKTSGGQDERAMHEGKAYGLLDDFRCVTG